jgi:serine/threonine-protein kinase RsbW
VSALAAETTREFAAVSSELGNIDSWIEDIGPQWGLSERTVFRARVCIAELATNAIEHGEIGLSGKLSVTLRNRESALEIQFTDPGRPFDPLSAPLLPKIGNDAEDDFDLGGRGLQLLRAYASEFDYRRVGDTNVLTFRIAAPPAP